MIFSTAFQHNKHLPDFYGLFCFLKYVKSYTLYARSFFFNIKGANIKESVQKLRIPVFYKIGLKFVQLKKEKNTDLHRHFLSSGWIKINTFVPFIIFSAWHVKVRLIFYLLLMCLTIYFYSYVLSQYYNIKHYINSKNNMYCIILVIVNIMLNILLCLFKQHQIKIYCYVK